MGWHGAIDHITNPCLGRITGAGIERGLMDRGQKQAGVIFHHGLGSVAVMDIKVDDCYSGEAKALGKPRGNGHIAKDAKAHSRARFCMVPRWPDGAEGPVMMAINQTRHRIDNRASRAPGCRDTARRKKSVGVQLMQALIGRGGYEAVQMGARMNPLQILQRRKAGLAPQQA